MEEMLKRSGGRRSVPQIFIGETHIGGYDDLYEIDRNGDLNKLLEGNL
jgi:glutaredoxin 3